MTIVTLTDKGTVKFPTDIRRHLRNATHLQVRLNAHGVTLTPVVIQTADLRAIPGPTGAPPPPKPQPATVPPAVAQPRPAVPASALPTSAARPPGRL